MRALFTRLTELPKPQRFMVVSLIFVGFCLFIFGVSYQLRLLPLRLNGVETKATVIDVSEVPETFSGTEVSKTWYTLKFVDEDNNVLTYSQTRPDKLKVDDTVEIVYNEKIPSEFIDAHVLDNVAGSQLIWSIIGGIMIAFGLVYLQAKAQEK